MYYYFVYNHTLLSDIEILNIPELKNVIKAELNIKRVNTPSSLIPNNQTGTFYSQTCMAMSIDCGTLEVKTNDTINIYLKEGYNDHDVAPFIIGWGFAFLFAQRGYSIFHCSALNINNKGVIISGVSGAGKSSTALSLINKGAKYLVDDLAILKPTESLDIIPAYPVQKICRDVSIDIDSSKLVHINEGRDKYAYNNENDYCNIATPITHLVLLNIHDCENIIVKEHTGLNKVIKVLECLYLNELYVHCGTPDSDKFNCLKIAEAINVIEISRPKNGDSREKIASLINDYVSK